MLLIDAGDMWQGKLESNLSEGAALVDAYNSLGYTAVALGNHEFDFGPAGPSPIAKSATDDPRGALKQRATEADFPFLAANLIDQSTGEPVRWPNIQPSALIDVKGIKVGIIGVMTQDALTTTLAAKHSRLVDRAARRDNRERGSDIAEIRRHCNHCQRACRWLLYRIRRSGRHFVV